MPRLEEDAGRSDILDQFKIRREQVSDHARVYEIQKAAFGQDGEAHLVNTLRERARPFVSLVAVKGDDLVGHVLFSPVTIEETSSSENSKEAPTFAGLAPLAVTPETQSMGAGSALVRAGLQECARIGWQAVFLLGDPAYYSRFGFELAAEHGLRYESEAFDAGFQMIELVPDVLSECRGWVRYHEAFSDL